jgi:predicted transcriptional regulator
MNYRGKLDIIADILTDASQNAKRTQIRYQANLSYKVIMRYLDKVVAASLLSFEHEQQRYVLIEEGKKFLAAYKEILQDQQRRRKTSIRCSKKKADFGGLVQELQRNKQFNVTGFLTRYPPQKPGCKGIENRRFQKTVSFCYSLS